MVYWLMDTSAILNMLVHSNLITETSEATICYSYIHICFSFNHLTTCYSFHGYSLMDTSAILSMLGHSNLITEASEATIRFWNNYYFTLQ